MRAIACLVLLCFVMTSFAQNFLGLGGPYKNSPDCQYTAEVNCMGPKTLPDGTVITREDVQGCYAPHIPCITLGFRPHIQA